LQVDVAMKLMLSDVT